MKVLIIDTKAGNLFSLKAAITRLGFITEILQQPPDQVFDAIVIPGQGHFGAVIKSITENQWQGYLEKAYQQSIPILGICVGMQIFFEGSDEDPNVGGLSWFKGQAKSLNFPKKPMVGWATLKSDLWQNDTVYFVNSYAVKQSEFCIAETRYGETFCAAVKKGSFVGVQFHPEKSGKTGSQLIKQVLTNNVRDNI